MCSKPKVQWINLFAMTNSELHALTLLLDDPDTLIYEQIAAKIISMGEQIVPMLENTWRNSENILVHSRIEQLVDTINFQLITDEFDVWNSSKHADLFDALMIINRIQYPNVDCTVYYNMIDAKVREIWLELNENLTAFEKVNVLNKVIFEFWNFKTVNEKAYDVFQYNFLSNLMELKCGNQFSIACLYLVFAEKLDLPIHPILLEDQLVLCYTTSRGRAEEIDTEDILFYINPNEKGTIFDSNSIRHWILKHELENKAEYYLPVNVKRLIEAYIDRLIGGFQQENDTKKITLLSSLKH